MKDNKFYEYEPTPLSHTHTCTQQIVRYLFVDQWHLTKSKPMYFVRSAHHLEKLHTNSDNKIVITTTLLTVETASYLKGRLCRLLLFRTLLLGRGHRLHDMEVNYVCSHLEIFFSFHFSNQAKGTNIII